MMRTMVVLGMAVAAVACSGGGGSILEPSPSLVDGPVEITLETGQTVALDDGAYRLTLTQVVEDSRCPADATCVWEGRVGIEVGVAVGSGPSIPVRLYTALDSMVVETAGLRLEIVDVRPAPKVAGSPIAQDDYVVVLEVERVG